MSPFFMKSLPGYIRSLFLVDRFTDFFTNLTSLTISLLLQKIHTPALRIGPISVRWRFREITDKSSDYRETSAAAGIRNFFSRVGAHVVSVGLQSDHTNVGWLLCRLIILNPTVCAVRTDLNQRNAAASCPGPPFWMVWMRVCPEEQSTCRLVISLFFGAVLNSWITGL